MLVMPRQNEEPTVMSEETTAMTGEPTATSEEL